MPVIVCSALMDTYALTQVLTLGAYDYFSKPLSEEVMKIYLPLKVRNAIELMNRTKHIIHLSQIDSLTGFYNRSYFKKYIQDYPQGLDQPLSIFMADINGLKITNDAFGSEFGDQFLIKAAKIMKRTLPPEAVCSRWGGDEFVAFVPHCGKDVAERLAIEMRTEFLKSNKGGLNLSLAVGWDTLLNTDQDLAKIMICAEDIMIRSKIFEDVSVRSNMITAILQHPS